MNRIAQDIHQTYQKERNISKVKKYANERYASTLGKELTYSNIKTILSNPIYVGKPTYGGVSVDRPELAMVEEKVFVATQAILERKARKYKKKENVIDELQKRFGTNCIIQNMGQVVVICQECGSIMVENGTRQVRINGTNIRQHNYLCPNCGRQSTHPSVAELWNFIGNDLISCPRCREVESFDFQALTDGGWRYTCRCCGFSFETHLHPNKHLRRYPKTWQKPQGETSQSPGKLKKEVKKGNQVGLDKYRT